MVQFKLPSLLLNEVHARLLCSVALNIFSEYIWIYQHQIIVLEICLWNLVSRPSLINSYWYSVLQTAFDELFVSINGSYIVWQLYYMAVILYVLRKYIWNEIWKVLYQIKRPCFSDFFVSFRTYAVFMVTLKQWMFESLQTSHWYTWAFLSTVLHIVFLSRFPNHCFYSCC